MSQNAKSTAQILQVRQSPHQSGMAHTRGVLTLGEIAATCALGRSGVTKAKREGDGATPLGQFKLLQVYYRPDRISPPATSLPLTALREDMGWCDDPHHGAYNQRVTLPFPASHEKLWRDDALYDVIVVLDYNLSPAISGEGSAIFFHCARPDYTPTEGCVAVNRDDMLNILSHCETQTVMNIAAAQ